ncbi:MAG: bifunctional methylenetetrahydrofolate dehydrogenase/methenyltetrahydrofolate cyclohydrolase [Epsilonproteobacteria bacterium]|nr:MAG: bifunctional methylenetetrahydrofolate dehydrogenase/methenyltetrahydrofolate cyclohydrolase [Campylobacterota bacterium]
MKLLDGIKLSNEIKIDIKRQVQALKKHDITPGLAVIIVGDDTASMTYVNMKSKACDTVGIYSIVHKMPANINEQKIIDTINMMNNNDNIDGILVQLPLPNNIDESKVIQAINPQKDVDGFHPFNIGSISLKLDGFIPATPYGVIKLLKQYKIELKGKNVCIVGASNIVGKPLMSLFLNEYATVQICHIYTKNLKQHTLNADILCVAVGKINLITSDMIKEDVIVVDIGINKNEQGKLVGDVDFDDVSKKCEYISPVPGGVGPMTIAMLLDNTIKSAKKRKKDE